MKIDRQLFREVASLRLTNPGLATGLRQGDRRSPFLGRGVEFADYREYEPGDDLRMVDWNVYERLQQVLVRLFHEDRNLEIRVLVDASGSMGFGTPRKLDHAGEIAACVALVGLLHRDTVTLGCFGGIGPRNGVTGHNTSGFPGMLRLLEGTEANGACDAARELRVRVESGRADRTFLVTDLLVDDVERERILRVLAASSPSPVLLHVLSDDELTPDLSSPSRVVDCETGEEIVVRGGAGAAAAYQDTLDTWLEDVRRRCSALRIQYVPAYTTIQPRELLTRTLIGARVVQSAVGGRA